MILIFFASVILYLLPPLHCATYDNISMPICPDTFSCLAFGPFNYPFYEATNKGCGLIAVNCSLNHEKIQLGEQSYEIAVMLDAGPLVLIHNRTFQNLLVSESCEALMDNFTSPTPYLYSISILPLVTIFRCANDPEIQDYFNKPDYSSYNRCTTHKFYYKRPTSNASAPSDLPRRCEVIQLPGMAYQLGIQQSNYTNIFSPLISGFSISFPLSPSYEDCHNKGGQCHTREGNFQCLYAKNGTYFSNT
ncbi:hypothetical protein L1987_69132 [Smallanthus sonchifolius]|uniref:Uncharacterized protein n=1 Tax=Smallanthus sonchifolius TaxID=185202 RepID=A0ACB9B4S9_9ASTR|nr:hypothetical protein L1987_69132 [Smallanthus sonchifolius]